MPSPWENAGVRRSRRTRSGKHRQDGIVAESRGNGNHFLRRQLGVTREPVGAGGAAPAAGVEAADRDDHVKLPAEATGRANCGPRALTLVSAMLADGNSIDDLDVVRHTSSS